MIYDDMLQPIGHSEYQERLLSQTLLLVVACGGEIRIPPDVILAVDGQYHVLEQTREPDGTVVLKARPKQKT